MNSLVSAKSVRFDEDSFWLDLSDGRMQGVPLARFPRRLRATPAQRGRVTISTRPALTRSRRRYFVEGLPAGRADWFGKRAVTLDDGTPGGKGRFKVMGVPAPVQRGVTAAFNIEAGVFGALSQVTNVPTLENKSAAGNTGGARWSQTRAGLTPRSAPALPHWPAQA